MGKKIIKCSQCNEEFETGFEYRMHWETHLDDYLNNIEIETKSRMKKVKRIGSFVKVKNEALQNKKKKK